MPNENQKVIGLDENNFDSEVGCGWYWVKPVFAGSRTPSSRASSFSHFEMHSNVGACSR
ncbi:hypothetical protein EMIT0P74_70241 [Pseudomonas sp. IT-P74]